MQVFVRVVEHGSFRKAADALGISPASATAAVARLEKQLRVRLLHRTTRRLSVTEEGQSYYCSCVRILGDVAEAEDVLSGVHLVPRGRLRISVPQSFVSYLFFPALKEFLALYPQLEVEVVLGDRAVNLVEEGIDCAIRGVEIPPDSGLVARTLSIVHWLTCASPAYLEKHGVPSRIEDLSAHNCIRFISPSTGRPRDWMFISEGVSLAIVPGGNLRLTSFDAACALARAGAGVAQLPDALGYEAVRTGELVPVLAEWVAPAPTLTLVYPGNRYLPAKVRIFSDFMAAKFPKEGWWADITGHARSIVAVTGTGDL